LRVAGTGRDPDADLLATAFRASELFHEVDAHCPVSRPKALRKRVQIDPPAMHTHPAFAPDPLGPVGIDGLRDKRADRTQQALALGRAFALYEKCVEFDVAAFTTRRCIGQMPHENVATFGIVDQQPSVAVRTGMKWNRWIFHAKTPMLSAKHIGASAFGSKRDRRSGIIQTETLPVGQQR
jgi:hypothetical protein